MEIDAESFVKIMNKNFGCKVIETELGNGVVMNPFKAFIYSTITGAGYLDDPLYPFTPKGLMKLFYNALDYKFVTGIFDNTTIKNTPYILSLSKRFLFESDKIIIPVEFENEMKLQSKLKRFVSEISIPSTNFIIQRIEKSKSGNGMEPFMEYLACEIMKGNDMIVENQIPLSHGTGSPDFGGYRINSNLCFNKIHIIELSLIRLGYILNMEKNKNDPICIVGEAKTGNAQIKKQIEKYLKTNFFNECYEIRPEKKIASDKKFGLITINSDYKIKVIERNSSEQLYDSEKQEQYIKWLSNYFKYYLIANLTNDEFLEFYRKKRGKKITGINDVIVFVNSLSYSEILEKIEAVCNGAIQR